MNLLAFAPPQFDAASFVPAPGTGLRIVPFRAWHARHLNVQAAQRAEMELFDESALAALQDLESFTAMDGPLPFACAGLIPHEGWKLGRCTAWAILGEKLGAHRLLYITRAIRARLAVHPARRIEMTVDCSFASGLAWALRLGFTGEGLLEGYGPIDGRNHFLFSRAGGNAPAALFQPDDARVGVAACGGGPNK